MQIFTSRVSYRGPGKLDVTVKSGDGIGKVFAPTWDMVMSSKRGLITWDEYTERYYALMRQRYAENKAAFVQALQQDQLVLCCYCKDTSTTTKHCHRYLLVDILLKVAAAEGINAVYGGEIK